MPSTNLDLFAPIPADTANAALLVIRNGNFYLSIGRLVNSLFSKLALDDLSNDSWMSSQKIAMLYLVTIFQYTEMLSDQQVAEALQKRVDWKYALHLPLNFTGLAETEFCEFRRWVLADQSRKNVLQTLLKRLSEITQAIKKPRLSGPNTDVILKICLQNWLVSIWSLFSAALHRLATEQPAWLGTIYQPHWYRRYGKSPQAFYFSYSDLRQIELAHAIASDGFYLLNAVATSTLADLQDLPEIFALKQVWEEQFEQVDDLVVWRISGCTGCMKSNLHETPIRTERNIETGGD
jgi:transposase